MNTNRISLLVSLFIVIPIAIAAQGNNVFLNRDYWKANPSIEEIESKIAQGHSISELNRFAFDAVSWALIENVDNETVKHLLSKEGNGVNKLTHDGRTYIFWAAYRSNLEMMKYLVDNGAKTDIIDSHGYSLMNFAAVTGQLDTELYDFCIKNGADITLEKNHDGANAMLLVAPFLKDMALIEYFISKGATINDTDDNGNGLFNYATKGGNIEMLKLLISNGLPYKEGNAMLFASQGTRGSQNTIEVYRFLKQQGVSANVIGREGQNPLHAIAWKNKNIEIFKFFMDEGVDVNLQDNEGRSPFMNAVNGNTLEVVKFLMPHASDINTKDRKGRTALAMAVSRNSTSVVAFLLENGADTHSIDKEGNTIMVDLLNTFGSKKDPEAFEKKLKLLTAKGLDLTLSQAKGNTLYHLAIEKNNLDLLKRIYQFGVDVNAKNKDGISPLHLAAMKTKDKSILKYLLEIGADKTAKTDFEESAYDLASENELLQKHHVDIEFLK